MKNKRLIFDIINKNRYLILACAVLIGGTFFGMSMLEYIPENICKNLYVFISQKPESFYAAFMNKFCFPFFVLFGIYLAGFSALGYLTSYIVIFISGIFFGFENGMNYMFYGTDYIITSLFSYFSSTLYFGFMILVLAESSVFLSKRIMLKIKNDKTEIPHYNAKKQTVKFVAFTLIAATFSGISACVLMLIRQNP